MVRDHKKHPKPLNGAFIRDMMSGWAYTKYNRVCMLIHTSLMAGVSGSCSKTRLDDRVSRKQVGGREQIEGKKSEVTEDE